jgi:DNA polymerase III subunit epsilon
MVISKMKKSIQRRADTAIILDFETTGLSAENGDRAIEIGAVRIEQGKITDRFQSLMNPGRRVDPFIESYTGITNAMLRDAPTCKEVMSKFADFIEDFDLVAHNASFDSRFLTAELRRVRRLCAGEFACSMLVARRLYQDAANHKLGTLVKLLRIPHNGTFHRALADADMTAHLWLTMLAEIKEKYRIKEITFPMMQKLSRTATSSVSRFLHGIR